MKKLLLLLLCVPLIGLGQQTYVPDDNFEQALINLSKLTENIKEKKVGVAGLQPLPFLHDYSKLSN